MDRHWTPAIFTVVFLAHALSPITTAYDSRWTVHVAVSLLDRGDTNLDEYLPMIEQEQYYAVECVDAQGQVRTGPTGRCQGGHFYNSYPVGVPVLALPLVMAVRTAMRPLAGVLPHERFREAHPVVADFLAADVVRGHALTEMLIASFLVALTAAVLFQTARAFLAPSYAVLVSLVFAFATSAWSTGSRALWQHTPSMLLISIALCLLVRAERKPRLAQFAAIPVALAYTVRPTDSLLVAVVTVYVLRHYRRYFWRYLLWALPIAAAFLAYTWSVYGKWFSPYYSLRPPLPDSAEGIGRFAAALAGNLVSPSRGLLVFTPILLFSLWGIRLALRTGWQKPLSYYLAVMLGAHWLVTSLFVNFWWGGHSYGPRLFTDVTPVLAFFLIPVFERWQDSRGWARRPGGVVFLLLLGASVFIHGRGAWSHEVYRWNVEPVNVDTQPDRVWDWRDPQFVRGLGSGG